MKYKVGDVVKIESLDTKSYCLGVVIFNTDMQAMEIITFVDRKCNILSYGDEFTKYPVLGNVLESERIKDNA